MSTPSASWSNVPDRFWPKVDKSDNCWEWRGARSARGYGHIRVGPYRKESTHRVAYRLAFGQIPDGLSVLHHCDNPPCVRPDHLFLGRQADNMADMAAKGRHVSGVRRTGTAHHSSITRPQADAIREALRSGLTQREAARRFGVGTGLVNRIAQGTHWSSAIIYALPIVLEGMRS